MPSPASVARSAASDEPDEQREADDPLLRRHRHRRGVRRDALRVLARDPAAVRVLAREPTGADADHRVRERDAHALADEVRATRGDAVDARVRLAHEVVSQLRHREQHRERDEPQRDERDERPTPPDDRGRDDDSGGERDEARLREGDEQTEPGRDDDGVQPRHPPAAHAAEQDPGERGEHRDREVTAVDRRVPEHGVHAEERRIGVEDLHARVPEDVAGEPLVAADEGVQERGRDEPAPEPGQPAAAPRQPREPDRDEPEREHERREEDRAAPDVARPEHREPRPAHEGGERQGDRTELARARVALQERPGDRETETADHRVEGQEQVDRVAADVDRDPQRDAGEGREREQVRPAIERPGEDEGGDEPADRACGESRRAQVGQEVDPEHAEAGAPRARGRRGAASARVRAAAPRARPRRRRLPPAPRCSRRRRLAHDDGGALHVPVRLDPERVPPRLDAAREDAGCRDAPSRSGRPGATRPCAPARARGSRTCLRESPRRGSAPARGSGSARCESPSAARGSRRRHARRAGACRRPPAAAHRRRCPSSSSCLEASCRACGSRASRRRTARRRPARSAGSGSWRSRSGRRRRARSRAVAP